MQAGVPAPWRRSSTSGLVAWSPLGGGIVTGKYNSAPAKPDELRRLAPHVDPKIESFWHEATRRNLKIMEQVNAIAREIGRPAVQVAIRFGCSSRRLWACRSSPRAPSRNALQENLGALEFTLNDAVLARLDEASLPAIASPLPWAGPYPYPMLEYRKSRAAQLFSPGRFFPAAWRRESSTTAGVIPSVSSPVPEPTLVFTNLMPAKDSYDYIVARRRFRGLRAWRICLVLGSRRVGAAGGGRRAGRRKPAIHDPRGMLSLWGSDLDWKIVTEPVPGLNGRTLPIARGKVLGGCSSIFAMVHVRGNPRDFDHWRLSRQRRVGVSRCIAALPPHGKL